MSFLIFFSPLAFAQEEIPEPDPQSPVNQINQRALGDQIFAISAGINIPLFTVLINDNPEANLSAGANDSKLSLGGGGALTYGFYLSPNIKLGLRIAGSFTQDINENWLYMIPITVKGSYEFHPFSRMSIPLHLSLGLSFDSWNTEFLIDPVLMAGFGLYFDWSVEWSFGIDFSYSLVTQLGAKDAINHTIGNFMEIFIAAEYHF